MMLRLSRPLTEDEYLAIYMPPSPDDARRGDVERDLHDPSWHAVARDGRRDR
jgi:hypothetical protein